MRVAFDARVLERPELAERGIGRYAASLLEALRAASHDVAVLSKLRRPPAPDRIAELLEHALLAHDVKRTGADVLHSPSIDFATTRPKVPYVVTVHDLVPLKRPGELPAHRCQAQAALPRGPRRHTADRADGCGRHDCRACSASTTA